MKALILSLILGASMASAMVSEISDVERLCSDELKQDTPQIFFNDGTVFYPISTKRLGVLVSREYLKVSGKVVPKFDEKDIKILEANVGISAKGPADLFNPQEGYVTDWEVVDQPIFQTSFLVWIANLKINKVFLVSIDSREFALVKKANAASLVHEYTYLAVDDGRDDVSNCGFQTKSVSFMDVY